MKLLKGIVIPDCHVPYEDTQAFKLLLKVISGVSPGIIVSLGDFCDFYSVSAHDKDPNRGTDLKAELEACKQRLRQIEYAAPKAERYFLAGNHEDRLRRYLSQPQAKAMYNLHKIPDALELGDKWSYHPYKTVLTLGKMRFTHDVGKTGKYVAQQTLDRAQYNIAVGHAHRLSYCVEGNIDGKPHFSACFGWLGDWKQADYVHELSAKRDWSLGFGTFNMLESTGEIFMQVHTLVNYKVVVDGKLYSV